jgi:AraC-like DNA-binding protein
MFSTTDPDLAHAYIAETYIETAIRRIGDQAHFRMCDELYDLGWFGLENFTYAAGLEQLIPPVGRLMVARVVAGRWQRTTIGEERWMGRGDVCLVTQPDRPHLSRWDTEIQLQIISIDPSVLLDAAAAPGDLVPRFTGLTPGSADSSRLLGSVVDHLVGDVVASETARKSPLVVSTAARALAAALLEAFPNTAARDPVVSDRIDAARSRVLRIAVSYVHDHAHEDISIGDLAEAAGASRQAVHLAFRQHLQTTPRAYLERVRLDRVHRDLTDLDPQTTTVEQVAQLWGFARLERFHRYYRHIYGTGPEETLGR